MFALVPRGRKAAPLNTQSRAKDIVHVAPKQFGLFSVVQEVGTDRGITGMSAAVSIVCLLPVVLWPPSVRSVGKEERPLACWIAP